MKKLLIVLISWFIIYLIIGFYFLVMGGIKESNGNSSGAISDFSAFIKFYPDYALAYNLRGWSKYKLKDYSGAIVHLNKLTPFLIRPRYILSMPNP